MDGESVVDNEVLQNETETGESVEEVVAVDYTELLEQILTEEQTQTETLVSVSSDIASCYVQMQTVNGSLLAIVALLCLNFCWSCMRQWRKNILEMGE